MKTTLRLLLLLALLSWAWLTGSSSPPVSSPATLSGAAATDLGIAPAASAGPGGGAAAGAEANPEWADRLVAAAQARVGRTRLYDPAYVALAYPGGDVPADRGVCTDVVIRAYRDGLGIDLQQRVHEDMRGHFARYPALWGLSRPDRNIDHRRVPNLETFLRRQGAEVSPSGGAADFLPGDLVTQRLPGNSPHIALVSHLRSADGERPLVIHNIGAGTRLEDALFAHPIQGHFRWPGGGAAASDQR